ncbi:flagellar hook assembly protein FlgD [Aestuariispira insulae]|uniref:Basal-body rod modification protein FlgD n=1 Tax=Aestuariispira insulae TaxID=1461337 RepID=A0A3D9HSE5_9PROT|nr:flagellar hook capping FlgD N-terminal domain-containing protein [Aestuariispira insulae]RED52428.1 flagellar basal-body rod modification protein FlgD [Aestuariispira insulae]
MTIGSIANAASSNNSTTALNKLSNDLDSFLLILTTQLQNQDPLSPMDSSEFTNQLVQFANVEQAIQQSGYLENLVNLQKSNEVIGAVSYVGKTVEVDHNEFHKEADSGATLKYTLPEGARSATLLVMDDKNDVVSIVPVDAKTGEGSYEWDGKNASGDHFPSGAYSFQINAVDDNNNAIVEGVTYASSGKVTGVEYGDGKTILQMGSVQVDLSKVKAVTESSAQGS